MGTALLFLLPSLLIPLIVLVIAGMAIRAWRRAATGEGGFRAPGKGTVTGVVIAVLLGISLFWGVVAAAVIGAVAPKTVLFAAEMACAGTVTHESVGYSYKPGQQGVAQLFTCTIDGERRNIILPTFLYAGLTFSAGVFVVLLLLAAFLGPRLRTLLSALRGRVTERTGPAFAGAGSTVDAWAAPHFATEAAQQPAAEHGIGERLRELEELYRSGAVTRAEYEAARAKLLSEL